jgi:hypothetical protein
MKLKSKTNSLKAIAILALGMSAGAANALPYINGSLSASGGLDQAILGTTTSIVSQLNVLIGSVTGLAISASGDYAGLNGATAHLQTLDISSTFAMSGSTIWNIGAFTFIGSQIFSGPSRIPLSGTGGSLTDAVTLRLIGEVSAPGFNTSSFLADFTAQGACNSTSGTACTGTPTGSWSASIASNGFPPGVIPEPTSLSLFGIGLAGLFASRHRSSAKTVVA